MSLDIMNQVWTIPLPTNDKLVLLALANRHNSETGRCDPGQDCIAKDCSLSRKQVNKIVTRLSEKGLLTVHRRGFSSSTYSFNLVPELGYKSKSANIRKNRHVVNSCSPDAVVNSSSHLNVNDCSHDIVNDCSLHVENDCSHKPERTVNEPEIEPEQAGGFDPAIRAIAKRFAECRRIDGELQKVTPQAVSYYCDLLTGFIKSGEVCVADLDVLVTWFETPKGMESFAYGIGNMPKKSYEHPLKRNLAMYLSRARGNSAGRSANPTDRPGFLRYEGVERVEKPTEPEYDMEDVPF